MSQNYTSSFCFSLALEEWREAFKGFLNPKEAAHGLLAIGSKCTCEDQSEKRLLSGEVIRECEGSNIPDGYYTLCTLD